jgi:predicted acylesterase/phospholipase RssA
MSEDYLSATRKCDMVMKGGITSGVVYPRAICRLARTFRFVNIGGTSAGAIAAAAAAAAEYARSRGSDRGFRRLETLADELAETNPLTKRSSLLSLFTPNRETAPLFDLLLLPLLNKRAAAARFAGSLFRHAPLTLLSLLPSIALVLLAARMHDRLLLLVTVLCALLLGVLSFAAATVGVLLRSLRCLPKNFFGLCSGSGAPYALTDWMTRMIDDVAGAEGKPLTFGDLRDAGVQLQIMTTSVTHGRPYLLPFSVGGFYFDPRELERLFPQTVMAQLLAGAAKRETSVDKGQLPEHLLPFPDEGDVPVVVAARMSLSFPLLISAVPLWVIDFTREVNQLAKKNSTQFLAERCWFSDGGISSNFPIHLFDQPLPRWPTFGLNLRQFGPDHERSDDEERNVWMIDRLSEGTAETLTRFEEGSVLQRIGGFVAAIIGTMQNWRDNVQTRVPGYRDRIVHVNHADDEGGFNLEMDRDAVLRLARRGEAAGERLRSRFDPDASEPSALGWETHRWTRYRSTMSLVVTLLDELRSAWTEESKDPFPEVVTRPHDNYQWSQPAHFETARQATDELLAVAAKYKRLFQNGAPKPTPDLRIVPKI